MESQPQNPEFRNSPENFHPCTHSVQPHEVFPALFICHLYKVEEFFPFNTVCDILYIAKGIQQSPLLGTQDDTVEIGIHYVGAQPLELSHQLETESRKCVCKILHPKLYTSP